MLLNCFINKLKLRPLVVAVAGALAVSSLLSCSGDKQANQANVLAASQLSQQVLNPPQDAKPRVWWHWMNGNVTKEGIAADLAWMNKVGIGGVQNFDAQLMTPHIVDKPVSYMTDEWQDLFRFALA